MNQQEKEKIAAALMQRGVKAPCPRCNSYNFEIVGLTTLFINEDQNFLKIGGPGISTVIVACSNCGFITLHALNVLGIINNGK